jgi:L-seryl-tRNA(Ser) seleniumtransferase
MLTLPRVEALLQPFSPGERAELLREVVDRVRREMVDGIAAEFAESGDALRCVGSAAEGAVADPRSAAEKAVRGRLIERVMAELEEERAVLLGGVGRRIVNATGVVLHTNLGRAPLGERATAALTAIAPAYSVVEMDLATARRGRRAAGLERMLRLATGAEAALAVNNNAAAVLLALSTLARGREVIVSRGELVEIGGSFRIPDVMAWSGGRLHEVGTTNRTHLRDYAAAINDTTAAIMLVHPSNYHISGFTHRPELAELVALAHDAGIPIIEDQGSGYLLDPQQLGLPARCTVGRALESGVDLVTFSGDKILGGPQAGLLVGGAEQIDAMRANPFCRTVRLDRFRVTALEETLRAYVDDSWSQLPVARMLALSAATLRQRAAALAAEIEARLGADPYWVRRVKLVDGASKVGGGAFPEADLPTTLVVLEVGGDRVERFARALRLRLLPILGRIANGEWRIDPRTLLAGDAEAIVAALLDLELAAAGDRRA